MSAKALAPGERGQIDLTGQRRDAGGKWKRVTRGQRAERWRARCRYRDAGGEYRELSRFAATRAQAEDALLRAFDDAVADAGDMDDRTRLIDAGRQWLAHIALPAQGLSERTILDYGRTFDRYVDTEGSAVRGLTLAEANNAQRLRRYLQGVADTRGTGAAKITKSVLTGILTLAQRNGVLPRNAMRDVGAVAASKPSQRVRKVGVARDTRRAFTRAERDAVVAHADALARTDAPMLPATARKRQTTADLIAFMAGTGVRITEARRLRWDAVDLGRGRVEILGTKSRTSHRAVTLPTWLAERMRERAARISTGLADAFGGNVEADVLAEHVAHVLSEGYVFAAPRFAERPEGLRYAPHAEQLAASRLGLTEWDQSNAAHAVAAVLADAGHAWATPHAFRRTVATLASEAGAPLVDIADQLGHADAAMTARVYLGRDAFGERASVAAHL